MQLIFDVVKFFVNKVDNVNIYCAFLENITKILAYGNVKGRIKVR